MYLGSNGYTESALNRPANTPACSANNNDAGAPVHSWATNLQDFHCIAIDQLAEVTDHKESF